MEQALQDFLWQFHGECSEHTYRFLGCHRLEENGEVKYVFRVWAPRASGVSVVGDFNFWNEQDLLMQKISGGVWEAVSVHARPGSAY